MFNRIQAHPPATMVAKTASIDVDGGKYDTNRLIKPSRLILLLAINFYGL